MTAPAPLKGVHHVAYRCKDAKETVEFYRDALGMDFQLAIAEDKVPSTGAHDPYMHEILMVSLQRQSLRSRIGCHLSMICRISLQPSWQMMRIQSSQH